MKGMILTVGMLLLLLYVVTNWVSLRQSSEIRAWMTSRPSSEILVGVAWPFAANQDGMDEGLLLARDEINARGLMGKRIRLEMRDDRGNRERSRQIAIDFARNPNMVATIGYYDDKFAVRASAIFEESHLLHIVTGANNTYMTTHGFRYLIRSVLASERIGRSLARMCTERGYRNFAIVAEEGAFGEDLAYQTGTGLDMMNGRVGYVSMYVPGTVDFRDTVNELRAAAPDVVLFLGLETESALEMHAVAGPALEGVMFYEIYDVTSPTPQNQAFVASYRHRFGKDRSEEHTSE